MVERALTFHTESFESGAGNLLGDKIPALPLHVLRGKATLLDICPDAVLCAGDAVVECAEFFERASSLSWQGMLEAIR